MFIQSLALIVRSAVLILAILAFLFSSAACTELRGRSQHEFLAVLIDAATRKPVPSARIILAPKKEGKHEGKYECTIDTSLTGVSNDRGEVRIPNVGPGEYVVFQNPSGTIKPELKGKVVTWGGGANGYNLSLGPVVVKKGTLTITSDGDLAIANGYMETGDGDLGITTTAEGALLTVRVPSAGSAPLRIEIGLPQAPPNDGH
jgi:hypothetical protein